MSDSQITFRWPVHLQPSGGIAVCEVDSQRAVLESVARLGMLEAGDLPFAPGLGLPALELLASDPDPRQIEAALEAQEPDAVVRVVRMPEAARGEGWERLRIEVGVAGEESDGE